MAQETPLLNEIWNNLSVVLNKIFQLESLERKDFMSQSEFMALYNAVNRYFQSGEYDDIVINAARTRLNVNANANANNNENENGDENGNQEVEIPGGEFYYRAKKFFKDYLNRKIANNNRDGEVFLEFYAKTWETYQKSSQIANSILGGVNKGWIARQQKDKVPNIHDIYTVAMHIWQDVFFKDSNQPLAQTCLNLIRKERDGESINARLIQQVVRSYVEAGFTTKNAAARSVEQTLSTYKTYFEKTFLEETERYYRSQVNELVQTYAIVDYARKVYQRFQEEEDRVKNVLHEKTLEKIQELLTQILITNQIEKLQEELIRVLREEKLNEIELLFNLVNRVENANVPIIKELKDFTRKECLAAIQAISSTANRDPKAYCEAIIQTCLRFSLIVEKGFCDHQGYRTAIDEAFGSAINNNVVTQEAGRSERSPELLAAYCDILLKKGNKIENIDIEEKFNEIMIMFNYIEAKDAYLKFYGKRLAKRLVGQLSASDEFEESLILKIKDKCGFEYTSKLERMFKDIGASKNLIDQYKADCQSRNVQQPIDFYVMVLQANAWPFSSPQEFNRPIELQRIVDSFRNFFIRIHTGRKIEWLDQFSKGELKTLFTKPAYIFQVSTYQMTILLLFNYDDSLTVEAIGDKTRIDNETLLQVLLTLLKAEVLICSQIDAKKINDEYSEKNILPAYHIQVNKNFRSKKVKMNLNVPLRSVEQRESVRDNQQLDEERKFVIQAAIVRIMKTRKALKHSLLMQEVIQQLSSRFTPKVPLIKKCIDILIEKEYLERDHQERDQLKYLA